jgi:hypothetical protein
VADYRVLVTGSRTWKDYRAVRAALSAVADEARRAGHTGLIVVAGAAPYGADHDAMQWAAIEGYGDTGLRITYEPHPADWQPAQRGKPDLSAGYRRNADMVALGADVCLAFISPCSARYCTKPKPHGSHGASHCADLAEKAGIPVRRFTRDTSATARGDTGI